jgi:hypothetical protein
VIYAIAGVVVTALALLAFAVRNAVKSVREKRDTEWALKKFQLEVITEAAKKQLEATKEVEAEKAKLPDLPNSEIEKIVNK